MKTKHTLGHTAKFRAARLAAIIFVITLCFTTGSVLARGVGAGARGVGVRPGVGAGAPGVGVSPGVGLGAPGVGVLPKGYCRTVPAGYVTRAYAGYNCRYVGGVYYRPATYEGQTVWIIVQ